MVERYFHLFADGKTVKEIDFKTYQDYCWYGGQRPKKVAVVFKSGVNFYQRGHDFLFISKEQLRTIIRMVQ